MPSKNSAKSTPVDLLPIGATHYVAKRGEAARPIPSGVSVRSMRGVQIEFMYNGTRCTETLQGRPSNAEVARAVNLRETILQQISRKDFNYLAHFPTSKRAQKLAGVGNPTADLLRPTVGELLVDWLDRYRKEYPERQSTIEDHSKAISCHLRAHFGQMPVSTCTADVCVAFRAQLREGRSDDRVANVLTPLRGALELAVERGQIARSPFATMAPTKARKRLGVTLDEQGLPQFDEPLPGSDANQFAAHAKHADPFDAEERRLILCQLSGQVANLFAFAFWTGLRTGELIALRWCDVDLKNKRICVRISFSKGWFTTTKSCRARWVPLLPPAMAALLNQWDHTGGKGTWVFNSPVTNDRWSSSERLRRRWRRALRRAGVRYRKQYQTRHTYASMLVSAGESPAFVAETMGHLDYRLISAVYARWLPDATAAAGAKTEARFKDEWSSLIKALKQNADLVTVEDQTDEVVEDVFDEQEIAEDELAEM